MLKIASQNIWPQRQNGSVQPARKSKGKDAAKASRVMQAMMKMVKLDIAGLERAYEGKAA